VPLTGVFEVVGCGIKPPAQIRRGRISATEVSQPPERSPCQVQPAQLHTVNTSQRLVVVFRV
jgi:hypothetical protein